MARLPIGLYRIGPGFILGNRFLMLTHVGRKTGLRRHVILEVVSRNRLENTCTVASGWGEYSNWVKNIQSNPEVKVSIGRLHYSAVAIRLPLADAQRELLAYARKHPIAFRLLARLMVGRFRGVTEKECRRLAEIIPLFLLRPEE